ncbi:MAG TPA: hypothetical protein P5250_01740, partial [Bacteroidales bacterium]|nr:hypothetical protein [Bacteroidales bacterium]
MNNDLNEIFEEGQKVIFKIIRTVVMPDNYEYFILESPKGNKHLLKKSYYKQYNLKENSYIECIIDKINCNGKIFIEPKHPFYEIGKQYNFTVINKFIKEEKTGQIIKGYIVEDIFHNKISVVNQSLNNDNTNLPSNLNCKVVKIKKGLPYLTLPETELLYNQKYLYCKIIDKININSDESYFVINDDKGAIYYLRVEDYEHFNFNISDIIKCLIIDLDELGRFVLEPVNPFYEINKIYQFKVKKWIEEKTEQGEIRKILIVKDILNKDARVFFKQYNESIILKIKENDIINCSVKRYKKGQLQLQFH